MGGKGDSILASSKWAWVAIVIVCAWQSVAMNTIIYISGLQTVPEDVYEAGSLDGATGWKKFKNLTFPLILPFFTINMVLCMKNFLMVFDQIMALTKGGPAQSTESISFLIYNNGMAGGQFGFQSANAVVFFVVIVVISVLQMNFWEIRRNSYNESKGERKSKLANHNFIDSGSCNRYFSSLSYSCDCI